MNFLEARDFIFSAASKVVSIPIVYTDLTSDIPDADLWCRFTLQHNEGSQSSLTNFSGSIKYLREGLFYAQVFSRIGQGQVPTYSVAQDICNALQREKNGCVWFRNVRINEIGQRGGFYQINVIAVFSYEDVQ